MKLELDFALESIRKATPDCRAAALGVITAVVNADHSPFAKVSNVKTVLAALDTVLAENRRSQKVAQ
ncbi:hypothetical protein [Paenibacillus sabinae]|uniref:Uncharacterized protein n=1 Tax=Paenibacillus sabinae T27 TaxID=1268072 RepID=X5A3W4_9BACL|nr:hypothetical protein [Paenibacillus sabinae]AHV99008.1 hypothetical protein PSAB_20585 [Paenibacillus sabinae T27]